MTVHSEFSLHAQTSQQWKQEQMQNIHKNIFTSINIFFPKKPTVPDFKRMKQNL